MLNTGKEFTVTTDVAVFVDAQPKELVPVTEQLVVVVGLTIEAPPEIKYEAAPDGTMVNDLPVQIAPLLTERVGDGFTVIVFVAGPEQP